MMHSQTGGLMKYLLILSSLLLIGCGKSNTTASNGKTNRFEPEAVSASEKIDLEANLKITMFSGNLIQTESFDLKAAPLEQARDSKTADAQSVKTKDFVFYINDLDKRMDFIKNMTASSLTMAEIQIQKPKNKNLAGTWGWLSHDGAITQKEALKSNSLEEKIVLKIDNKSVVESLLKNKLIFSLWLENLEIESSLDQLGSIKVQPLVYYNTFEVDRDQELNQNGYLQLRAFKRSFKAHQYDQAIRYTYWEETRGRHDKGWIKRTGTCHVRMQGVSVASEQEVNLNEQIEINYQAVSDHWIKSEEATSINFINPIASSATTVGLISKGSCHDKSDFIDSIPGSSQQNSADRIVIKANVYERLP